MKTWIHAALTMTVIACAPLQAEEILPLSDDEYLDARTFADFSPAELRLARNEIFARHGYVFSSADLTAHFSAQPWYQAVSDNNAVRLSTIETANIALIQHMEMRSNEHPEGEAILNLIDRDLAPGWRAQGRWDYEFGRYGSNEGEGIYIGQGDQLRQGDFNSPALTLIDENHFTWLDQRTRSGGSQEGLGFAMQFVMRGKLDQFQLTIVEEDWRSDDVTRYRVFGLGLPRIFLSEDPDGGWSPEDSRQILFDGETDFGNRVFALPQGYIVQPWAGGIVEITDDGIIVSAQLRGNMIWWDYDHHTFQPFQARFELGEIERLDLPADTFNPDTSWVEQWFSPG